MNKLDELIEDMVTNNIIMIREYPTENASKLKQQIKDLFLEIIGEDDRDYSQDNTDHDSKIYLVASSTAANDLRADLRKKVREL